MFELKTSMEKPDQPALVLPEAAPAPSREQTQRRMMTVALVLLLVALAVVIYRDRDFWFPDTPDAEDQLDPIPTVDQPAVSQPMVFSKSSTEKKSDKKASANRHAKTALATVAVAAPPEISAPPMTATTTRTVLPPLEVEVVAGDNHKQIRPGSNSVRVDLQTGSAPRAVTNASGIGDTENTSLAVNAAERVQMSAGTAEVVSEPVKPGYPMLARQMKVQGSVVLQALIGRDGSIQDLHVLSGPPILAAAAEEAVRQWRFKPHYVNNEAVETQANITVNFTISTN